MSERLKLNFTPVPNVILDEIMRGLNEGEFKTLMAICRYTYGWGKQSDQISLNQLADITGMNRSNVARARKRLGNLVEVTPGTATMASTYRLNIEISDAELKAASVKGSDPSATSDRSATSVKGSDPSATFQRKPKKERERAESDGLIPDSLSTKGKEKLTRPASDPRVRPFLTWFSEEYEARFASPYAVKWEKEGRLIKGLPSAFDLPKLKDLAVRFFDSTDPWILENGGFTIGVFVSQINKLTSTGANGNGHVKPVEVKDLGNGWVEVDGRQMDRKMYERRYGQATA